MIAVIDYDAGNIKSVCNALSRIGAQYTLTSDPSIIVSADRVLLPGVGQASSAMEKLHQRGLVRVIQSLRQPVLGICIGMQLMCRHSEEGNASCIGIFDTDVISLKPDKDNDVKVPHMGWNSVAGLRGPLFEGIDEGAFFYFVHSFAPALCSDTVARCSNGAEFSAALQKGNFFGTQFHPEKSSAVGERLLYNFLKI